MAQSHDKPTSSRPTVVTGEELDHWSGLPIWGAEEARERGLKLPKPLGLSANFYTESQDVEMTKLKLGAPGGRLFDASDLVRVSDIKTEQDVWNARFDSWVLPFLNVSAILGYVEGQAEMEVGPGFGPLGGRFAPKAKIELDYDGPVVGLGTTVAAGFRPFKGRDTILFGQSDFNFNLTCLDFEQLVKSLDMVDVIVFSTRLGVRERIPLHSSIEDMHLSLWVGAMYQHIERTMVGRLTILDLDFKADIEALSPWNPLVGGRIEIGEHFDVMVEFGMGGRQSFMIAGTVRF